MLAALDALQLRAATLDELLSDSFESLPGQKKDAQKAAARLAAWCSASSSGDWVLFARRLAKDRLSLEAVLPRLATASCRTEAPTPQWISEARWIAAALESTDGEAAITRLRDDAEPIAFESVFMVLVESAYRELAAAAQPAAIASFSEAALGQLCRALLKQLSDLCAPALFDHFVSWSERSFAMAPKARDAGANRDGRFARFLSYLRREGFDHLFVAKPVLLRLIASTTRQWIDSTAEFVIRVAADGARARAALLGLSRPSAVVRVEGGLSDLHNFGRSVLLVGFADGSRLLYKPKDLRPDAAWHELVGWLNRNGAPVELRAASVLACDGYGWAAFVEHRECESRQGLARFYERAGAWLALFHVFCAVDMHLENMIADGENPVPIDLEMIAQARDAQVDEVAERRVLDRARERVDASITATGLMPAYARSPENDILELGGLNGSQKQVTEACWLQINTDHMQPSERTRAAAPLVNVPVFADVPARLGDFTDALKTGFDRYGRFLVDNRARILDCGFFEAVAGMPVRKLLRPTRFYGMLLERLKDHRNMGDGAMWSAKLEFIARLHDLDRADDPIWPLLRAERAALVELNIPHFSARSDGLELTDWTGIGARDRNEPSLERVINRLRCFDDAEFEWQRHIVDITTVGLPGSVQRVAAEPASVPERAAVPADSDPALLLAAARGAAEQISKVAIRDGDGAAWVGLDWLGDSEVSQLVPLGFDLYNGAPGIALFLAAYAKVTADRGSAELSRAALAPMRSHLHGATAARFARGLGVGGASGLGSVVYALTTAGELLDDRTMLVDAHRVARLFTDELIASDRIYDVIGGSAGAILGLLKLYRSSGDADVLARATSCGQHLLRSRPRHGRDGRLWPGLGGNGPPLTGFSHGAAGFSYALTSLHEATRREEFLAAASDCVEFENRFFSAARSNWPDLRQEQASQSWPCQWCYGAGGIGLARIGAARQGYPDRHGVDADIRRAVACAARSFPAALDTLCCGSLGNIEFLDEAGVFLNDDSLREEAQRQLRRLASDARSNGDYRWGGGDKLFNLGLFRGVAGVGYTMLRRLSAEVPNVLMFD